MAKRAACGQILMFGLGGSALLSHAVCVGVISIVATGEHVLRHWGDDCHDLDHYALDNRGHRDG